MDFEVVARCSTTRARVSRMKLTHTTTMLPTFMPVATQAVIKGLTPLQVTTIFPSSSQEKREEVDPSISLILNNTYHLDLRPGTEILDLYGGSHNFQGWSNNLLTGNFISWNTKDSGGFQMVSLVALSKVTEEGVEFSSPYDPTHLTLLSPEKSMETQHSIGADIMMQLDDVVASLTTGERVEEAMWRSVRWLDRCIAFHKASGKEKTQNLFAIIQGGLDERLRDICLTEMLKRSPSLPGYAIGGLSGGEAKDTFWRIVEMCAKRLPPEKPRYCMGIGYGEDILVCVALGVDMADCVFPTRTARFGIAFTPHGPLNLRLARYSKDFSVIDPSCPCPTCESGEGVTRAYLYSLSGKETVGAHYVTQHNLAYMATLMARTRAAILEDRFPSFLKEYFRSYYHEAKNYPRWAVDALRSVGVDLLEGESVGVESLGESNGVKWDFA
ncbi:queuine tRNA-ribosyltransferase 1 [Atractiella rhizophila]|nr:queuine tRNA-ribosyltransferase 1 [Atractiella rhizophila]